MSEPGANPRRLRLWKYLLVVVGAAILILGGLAWYATTDSFQAFIRRRVVAELERITGGRVELGSFHSVPFRLLFEVRNLTIHGREDPDQIPYAHVDRVVAQAKLISALGAEMGLQFLVLERPVVHIIVHPDGSTNQPTPGVSSKKNPTQGLFSLSISRLEARHGELLWNDQKIPLDFSADGVSAEMEYSFLRSRYQGTLLLGKVDTQFKDYRPLAWTMEAHFGLSRNGFDLESLKATTGRSRLEAHGHLENFLNPSVDAGWATLIDLGEAGAIARRSEIRGGTMEVDGRGSWSKQQFSTTGKVNIKNFSWRDPTLDLRNATANSSFAVSSQRLTLSQIQAKLLGGEVTGDANVVNWLNWSEPNKAAKSKIPNEQVGIVRLQIRDGSANKIASSLSSQARPLKRANLAGATNGTVEARWRGSPRNNEAEINLDVTPPAQPSPGELPLTLHSRSVYRAAPQELEINEFTASTRATHIQAVGTLSSRASVRLSLNTTDLGELQANLANIGYEPVPVKLRGHASFTGTATGKLSAIAFAGRLQSDDFDVVIPATSQAPQRHIHSDSLAADVQLSPDLVAVHHGRLHHAETSVNFGVTAELQQRRLTDFSPITAHLRMQNADLAELMALLGYEYPVTGTMNVSLQARGTASEPRGDGELHISNATVGGETIQQFDSKLAFQGKEITFQDVHLTHDLAQVAGSGFFDFSRGAFRFHLDGHNFDLARIPQLQTTPVSVEGRLDFTAEGSGTVDEPVFNAKFQVHDLTLDHERIGDYTLDAVTRGPDMQLSGRSQFQNSALNLNGDVRLRDQWPSNISLHLDRLDLDPLLRNYLKGQLAVHSTMTGDLQIQGPVRQPDKLKLAGNLTNLEADVQHVELHNDGPLRFAVSDGLLNIQQFRLVGGGTDLTLYGTGQLSGEHQLDVHASGNASLSLVHSLNRDFTSSGTVALDVAAAGPLARPAVQGRLQITSGLLAYRDLPSALSDINGSLVFNQDRLEIETLTAHVGGGLVAFGGYATAYNRQLNFNLTLQGQDVRLRYPPGVSSMTNSELHFTGTPAASTLSGDITITKLAVTPGFDFGSYLERTAQTSVLPQTNPLLNRIRLDVHIVSTPELQMQTAVVRLSGDADMHLQGTAAKPVLLGRADIIEGEVYFNGQKYRMERGDVSFTNPVTTTPVLDLQAATHIQDYDITVNLNGAFDKLSMTYHSEPPLPTADILSLLALGRTQEQSAQLQQSGQASFAQQASSAALAEALSSALSNRSRSLLGISHIKIDPQGLNTETSPTTTSPAVTIEQQVKDNLTLTYSTNVSQTSQQIIQGEYFITRNVSILGIRDYNGVVSFEVRIRQRKK